MGSIAAWVQGLPGRAGERGQTLTEYALIIALVVIVVIGVLGAFGITLNAYWQNIISEVASAVS